MCNKVLSCLKAMLRFGGEGGYVAENRSPAHRVKLLTSDSEVHGAFLTFDQYDRLKAKAREKRPGVRPTLFAHWLEWLMLACNSGLRPREQAMLEFSDVDLVHEFIHVQAKPDLEFLVKNYQDRYIQLVPAARTAVEAMLASRKPSTLPFKDGKLVPVDFIFHRPNGSPGAISPLNGQSLYRHGLEQQRNQAARSHYPPLAAPHVRKLARDRRRAAAKDSGTPRQQKYCHHGAVQPFGRERTAAILQRARPSGGGWFCNQRGSGGAYTAFAYYVEPSKPRLQKIL